MKTAHPSRILGLVKLLAAIALLTVVVMLSLAGWTLIRIRTDHPGLQPKHPLPQTVSATEEVEHRLAVGWRQLLFLGGGGSLIFVGLAGRISRDIHSQVTALEEARAAAEAGRRTTHKLMLEQQTATAELAAAHQNLQGSEIRFRSLSAAAPIGIYLNDGRGAALYFNPCWLSITGLTLEQSLGDGWQRALHPEDAATVLANRRTANRNGWGFNSEFRFCRPSGEIRWVQNRSVPIRCQTGSVTGFVGTTEDITERRQAEELLRLQEAALRSAANVVVITNRQGNIVWTNPAFTRITGYTAAEALGQNPRILKTKAPNSPYPAHYYQDLWETISSGRVWQGEFFNLRKDGSDLIEEATITPVPNATGELTHFVAVKQDITARKQAEAALAKAQKELLALSRQAGMAEVATGVLHNVGNVLNSVNVCAACATDRLRQSRLGQLPKVAALLHQHELALPEFFANDPRARQLPGYLKQLADHLAGEQTRTLAELAELQKHVDHIKEIVVMQQAFAKVSGVAETVPVTELLEDALLLNASSLDRHAIEVRKDFAATPVISVDKHKALQILVNLLHNAQQACLATDRDDKQITLRVLSAAGRVRICVADNGVGIPPEHLERIFNHGFTTKKDGHGFGLHSGANAARELGGTLQAHSAGPGHGAAFTLDLPLAAPAGHRQENHL
jgi:PAS domain S-box-containing protein